MLIVNLTSPAEANRVLEEGLLLRGSITVRASFGKHASRNAFAAKVMAI